jgi:methionine synthase I (cobalamin-dependent)
VLQAPTPPRRNTFACNLVSLGDYDIPDGIREPWLKRTAIAARVGVHVSEEMGVQTSVG